MISFQFIISQLEYQCLDQFDHDHRDVTTEWWMYRRIIPDFFLPHFSYFQLCELL
jgi:hypothetical protein